jgi:hypothetical protein
VNRHQFESPLDSGIDRDMAVVRCRDTVAAEYQSSERVAPLLAERSSRRFEHVCESPCRGTTARC